MTRDLLSVAVVVALVGPQHSTTVARPASNITDLGTLTRGRGNSGAFGVNNRIDIVQVVGWSHTASQAVHGFVWTRQDGMVDLGTLLPGGGGNSQAWDVNNHHQIAGYSSLTPGQLRAVVWTKTGNGWAIENLGIVTGSCCAQALGINNGGGDPAAVAIVGGSRVSPTESHAVMWTKSPTGWAILDVGTLPGDVGSAAYDVNDDRAIVGVSLDASNTGHGFLWTADTGMVELDSLGGDTYALAINNSGDVAGLSADIAGNRHAVRWRAVENWELEDLGTLDDGCCSEGPGINSFGDVAGFSDLTQRRPFPLQHAFLFTSIGMTDLGAIRGSSAAWDLNDFGVVVGESDSRGSLHAVLWTLPTLP
jgi:probable HAF family extracellular repeat protein